MPWFLELLVVVSANLLGAAMSAPQAVRLVRTRRVDGVSPSWAAMSVVLNAWWVAYGLGVGSWAIIPVAAASVVGYLVIVAGLVVHGDQGAGLGGTATRAAFGVATVPAIGLLLGGWAAAGVALGAVYAVQLAPAVLSAYRSADLGGVSPATWVVAAVEALLWGAYGLVHDDVGLVTLAVAGVTLSGAVLVRLALWHAAQVPGPARRQAESRFA